MRNLQLKVPALLSALGLVITLQAQEQSAQQASDSSKSAQEKSATNSQPSRQQQQHQATASERSADQLKVSKQDLNQQVTDVNKASKLIGMTVKNKNNESLGTIRDIVLDINSGKVAYAVLSSGSTLGMGGKNIAIPFQALTVKPGEKALLLDLNKQQLAQAPGFDDKHWPELNAAASGKTVGLAAASAQSDTNNNAQAVGGSENAGEQQPQTGSASSSQHQHDSGTSSQTDTNNSSQDTNNSSQK